MTLRIDDATPEDIRHVALNMRDSDYAEFLAVSGAADREQLADALVARFKGVNGVLVGAMDEPVCIGGVIETRPNVITLLFFATDRFPEISFGITRFITAQLFPRLREAGVHRIEATAMCKHRHAQRWLKILGLTRETGVLRGYGRGGEGYYMFSWVDPCL